LPADPLDPADPFRLPPLGPPDERVWRGPARRRRRRPWTNWLLFFMTAGSTTLIGALHYAGFISDFGAHEPQLGMGLLVQGFWYSGTILAILGCHEMGHYLACRYYGVDASPPYFIPAPILTGTLGAFIRIREPIRSKRVLFDVGVAGPIAGFVIAVPALFFGLMLSRVTALPATFEGLSLGEPLLFRGVAWLIWGATPEGYSLNLHPMAFAAWFGLLATALNLFPIGQLDGGHISYAVLGPRSTLVTLGAVLGALLLTLVSTSWIVWSILLVLMLFFFGPRHPPTLDEHVPLDRTRLAVALFAVVMFALCFTPAPIEVIALLPH
jgi:membrane-associated protease RseP (regulator of RpoE activity)